MTTVHLPRTVPGTGAIPGEAGPTGPVADVPFADVPVGDVIVLPGSLRDRALHDVLTGDALVQPGDRLRRLQQRRRLVREEFLAVMFLVVALAVTVSVLALQWLDSGASSAGAVPAIHPSLAHHLSGGPV